MGLSRLWHEFLGGFQLWDPMSGTGEIRPMTSDVVMIFMMIVSVKILALA
jgi:hypothetical protein